MMSAPLRFLLLALAFWVGVRAAVLLSGEDHAQAPGIMARTKAPSPAPAPFAEAAPTVRTAFVSAGDRPGHALDDPPDLRDPRTAMAVPDAPPAPAGNRIIATERPALPAPSTAMAWPGPTPHAPARSSSNSPWSVSAWLLVRDEAGGAALAPGGTLGGSQAGLRISHAVGGRTALSGRVYLPLRHPAGAELAAGLDWRPSRALPVNILAERRQRLGREGRSAFALTAYGGTSQALAPHLRLDLYGQAGMVGIRSRNLFADGSVRLSRAFGAVEFGAGVWGAAQPGAARLDAGPSLSWRLPPREAGLRLQADWRFRLAGDAAPRSGPALTLATDF